MSTSFKNRFYSAPPTSQNVQMGYAYGAQSVVTGANLNVTGNWVPMNTDAQGNLNVAIANWAASTIASNNIPSSANGLALSANNARRSWFVQNNSTGAGPLFLGLGSAASAQAYHMILKSTSSLNAADGGILLDDGARWRGSVFVSGQNPNYIIWELT